MKHCKKVLLLTIVAFVFGNPITVSAGRHGGHQQHNPVEQYLPEQTYERNDNYSQYDVNSAQATEQPQINDQYQEDVTSYESHHNVNENNQLAYETEIVPVIQKQHHQSHKCPFQGYCEFQDGHDEQHTHNWTKHVSGHHSCPTY